ncbi:MAG: prolyl oligopeptidase family serine peptidase [Chitinophagaceae bacterium]|nr:prolyl oligopeptidase family serine peptidase [Chitinophagaceae bacterium]
MRILSSIITLLIVNTALAQDSSLFKRLEFTDGKDVLNYRMLYPSDYDVNKKYPLIVVLHGSGERGSDNSAQLKHGGKLFLDSSIRVEYPAFVVFPQCPADDFWAKMKKEPGTVDSLGGFEFISTGGARKALGLVSKLVDSLAQTPQINTKKMYVGGLSMGGMGTFELLWRKPKFFAAAFPICGGGDPSKVKLYAKDFPLWVFHGDADKIVPVSNSRLMVNALRKEGAKVKYTEYPGVGHDSWDNAFAEPDLLKWLFAQEAK